MIDIRQLLSEKDMYAYALICACCDSVVFYYLRSPIQGERMRAELAVYPDGRRPVEGDEVICSSCRNNMHGPGKIDTVKITDDIRNMLDTAYVGKI